MTKRPDNGTVKLAVSHSSTSGVLVGTEITASGYQRAKFVFTFGTPEALATVLASSVGIWAAGVSRSLGVETATTYAVIPTAYLGTGSSAGLSNQVAVLDVAIPAGKGFLKVSGAFSSALYPHNATVELYNPVTAPPTHANIAPVIIG